MFKGFLLVIVMTSASVDGYQEFVAGPFKTKSECEAAHRKVLSEAKKSAAEGFIFSACVKPTSLRGTEA